MYQGFRFMDADAHILEPRDLFEKYLEPRFRTSYMPRTRTGYAGEPLAFCIEVITPSERCDGAGCTMPFGRDAGDPALVQAATDLVLPGHDAAYAELARHNFQSESFPAALDRAGIDRMVVYPTCGLWYTQDPHLDAAPAAAYRRAYNQWLHDFCQAAGGRVIGAASVDLRDAETAAREARRCVHDFGFRAVHINPAPVSPYPLYHDFYEPLWTALEDCDVPLAVHTGAGSPTDEMLYLYLPASMARPEFRLAMRAAQTTVAFTIGNMIASAALIMGGVLERHPRLKVVHLETGAGWASFWLDRLEAGIQGGNRGLQMPGLNHRPIEYFQRQCYIACDQDDPGIKQVIAVLGDDNIVISTDFGHPEGRRYIHAAQEMVELPDLSEESKRKIMWDNGARLYGIDCQ